MRDKPDGIPLVSLSNQRRHQWRVCPAGGQKHAQGTDESEKKLDCGAGCSVLIGPGDVNT